MKTTWSSQNIHKQALTKFNILYDVHSEETKNRRNILQYTKDYIWQTYRHHILNGGKQIISSKIRNKKRMSILPTLIQHSTGIISQYSTIGEKNKTDSLREEVKLSLFAGDMISYLKDPKNSTNSLRSQKHL
jgi:hypothetical protein